MIEKYVVQLQGLGIVDLKKEFPGAAISKQATIINDVGILAIRDKCKDSINFLIENLDNEQLDIRRIAIDYLGDLSSSHPLVFNASKALRKTIRKEKDASGRLHDLATKSLDKIERRAIV